MIFSLLKIPSEQLIVIKKVDPEIGRGYSKKNRLCQKIWMVLSRRSDLFYLIENEKVTLDSLDYFHFNNKMGQLDQRLS